MVDAGPRPITNIISYNSQSAPPKTRHVKTARKNAFKPHRGDHRNQFSITLTCEHVYLTVRIFWNRVFAYVLSYANPKGFGFQIDISDRVNKLISTRELYANRGPPPKGETAC